MSEFNIIDYLAQGSDVLPTTELGALLTHSSNFGWMPFLLPPVIHMGYQQDSYMVNNLEIKVFN